MEARPQGRRTFVVMRQAVEAGGRGEVALAELAAWQPHEDCWRGDRLPRLPRRTIFPLDA